MQINNNIQIIIKKAFKKRPFTNDTELEKNLEHFFYIGQISNEYEIISLNKIINKCCFLYNNVCNEIFFSLCTELQEHD